MESTCPINKANGCNCPCAIACQHFLEIGSKHAGCPGFMCGNYIALVGYDFTIMELKKHKQVCPHVNGTKMTSQQIPGPVKPACSTPVLNNQANYGLSWTGEPVPATVQRPTLQEWTVPVEPTTPPVHSSVDNRRPQKFENQQSRKEYTSKSQTPVVRKPKTLFIEGGKRNMTNAQQAIISGQFTVAGIETDHKNVSFNVVEQCSGSWKLDTPMVLKNGMVIHVGKCGVRVSNGAGLCDNCKRTIGSRNASNSTPSGWGW